MKSENMAAGIVTSSDVDSGYKQEGDFHSSPISARVSGAEKIPFRPQKEPHDCLYFSEPSGVFFNVY